MTYRKTLTIWVPAYNEEDCLEKTIREVVQVAREKLEAFEIIVVNDGSTDGTGTVADSLAAGHPEIVAIHHHENKGLASSFRECLARAQHDHIIVIPGDNAFEIGGIGRVFDALGRADVIISYRTNQSVRRPIRWVQSRVMSFCLNLVFGLKLHDYHGIVALPVKFQRQIRIQAIGTGYHIESMLPMIFGGLSYEEIPVRLNPEGTGPYPVFSPRTYNDLISTTLRLLFSKRPKFDRAPAADQTRTAS